MYKSFADLSFALRLRIRLITFRLCSRFRSRINLIRFRLRIRVIHFVFALNKQSSSGREEQLLKILHNDELAPLAQKVKPSETNKQQTTTTRATSYLRSS